MDDWASNTPSPTGNRAIHKVPNELWDAIFEGMTRNELLNLSVTCKSLQGLAQKALFSDVTLTAATEGNIKTLCGFLKTVLTIPRLAASVKSLDVAFISGLKRTVDPQWTSHRPQPTEAFYQEISAHNLIAPFPSLLSTQLQELAPLFEVDGERRYCILYNILLALILSGLSELQSLTIDYSGFNPRGGVPVIDDYTLPHSFAQGLKQLRYLSIRNLEGPHEIQNLNLAQHLIALPTLRTLHTINYLPVLRPAFGNTALSSLEVAASDWIVAMERYKLTELLDASSHINRIAFKIPHGGRLIGRGDFSTILEPIKKTLKTLVLDYETSGGERQWERAPWPQFFSLATFPVLTKLDISCDFFFGKTTNSSNNHIEDPDIVSHLPNVLEKLRIYDLPIEFPTARYGSFIHHIPGEFQLLGYLQKLGIAHRTGVLEHLKEVKLEALLPKTMSRKVLSPSPPPHTVP